MTSLKKNISYLYILVFAQYLVPLITTPYLSRVLGVAQFGNMGVAMALVAYMTMVIDWGFGLSGVQQVAQAADDLPRIREIFWDNFSAKLILTIACLLALGVFALFAPQLGTSVDVLLATSLTMMTSTFGFSWLLQGMERMASFTTSSLIGRLIPVPLVFFLVHKPEDAWIAALIASLSGLLATGVSIYAIAQRVPLLPVRLSWRHGVAAIHDGWHLFLSTGAISVYTTSTIVLLGLLSGQVEAGYFNGADRIKRAAQGAVSPLSTAMFPRINRLIVQDSSGANKAIVQLLVAQGAITFLISLALFYAAPWLTVILLGKAFASAVPTVRWLALTPFLIGLSNVFGINIMLPLGMRQAFMWVTIGGGAVNLALLIPLARIYGAAGAAASTVVTELVVTVVMGVIAFRAMIHRTREPASQ